MTGAKGISGIQIIDLHLGGAEKHGINPIKFTFVAHKQFVKWRTVVRGARGGDLLDQSRQLIVLRLRTSKPSTASLCMPVSAERAAI
jgi:hypothetical protein